MKHFPEIKVKFREWDCHVALKIYSVGHRLCIEFDDDLGDCIAVVTTNVPDAYLDEDAIFVKDYSENEGMLEALKAAGIAKFSGMTIHPQGSFVDIPVCGLTNETIKLWYKTEREKINQEKNGTN